MKPARSPTLSVSSAPAAYWASGSLPHGCKNSPYAASACYRLGLRLLLHLLGYVGTKGQRGGGAVRGAEWLAFLTLGADPVPSGQQS